MCVTMPWTKPSYVELLIRAIGPEFSLARYHNKMGFGITPVKFLPTMRNFQWLTQDKVQIARSAQPNYNLFKGDQIHEFNDKQIAFLLKNNIKTIISLNSKQLKPAAKLALEQKGIQHNHIVTRDFTAISLASHDRIDNIIENRYQAGAILFHCGYGMGRTGTGIAGWAMKEIMISEPDIFKELSFEQLHEFLSSAFGVEKEAQTTSIANYLKSLATVEPEQGSIRSRSLDEVSWASFVSDSSTALPPLPNRPPPPLPPRPLDTENSNAHLKNYHSYTSPAQAPPIRVMSPQAVSMQSLNTTGKLRKKRVHSEYGSLPSILNQRVSRGSSASLFSSSNGSVNEKSFYFRGFRT